MNKHRFLLPLLIFSSLHTLNACDSPSGLLSSRQEQAAIPVRVNLIPAASSLAASTVQIAEVSQLPEALRNSQQLNVIFDASRSTVQVQRNSDGTLSFPLQTSRSFDSNSNLTVLMTGDQGISFAIQLQTGTPFKLGNPPIQVLPGSQLSLGTRVNLAVQLQDNSQASTYRFNWEVGPSAAGPWQALSGDGPQVEWEPRQAGAYYVRLGITDSASRSVSNYLSPTPLVYINSPETLARLSPSSGRIIAGESIQLSANLPELASLDNPQLQWSYATSAQGPFQPIPGRGKELRWEPPGPGSYFLRIQLEQNGQLSTYTSGKAEVLVASPDDVIVTEPASGSLVRGQSITLSSTLPALSPTASYSWFYSFSPAGPFTPIAETGPSIHWTPPLTGEFYLRLRTFDPSTSQSQTYTSTQSEVSVRDSNTVFTTRPDPASLQKGQSVEISLNEAPSEQVSWSYSSSLQGAFNPIADTGKTITFTPTEAGSFYLRATATRPDGSSASFTSADPLVFVAERSNVIRTEPAQANLNLGQAVILRSDLGQSGPLRYSWSYSTSAAGPFTALQTLENGSLPGVTWYPPAAGSYFIKMDVTNPDSQTTVSFSSQEPLVRVSESTPFFESDPANGRIEPDDAIRLKSAFNTGNRTFNFGWAYSRSSAGPFTPLGGSSGTEFFWDDENKPEGSYYIRLQATAPGSDRSLSFVSSYPVVFISKNDGSGNEFGVPSP